MEPVRKTIGVLALQGAFREHRRMLEGLGADTRLVRWPSELERLDGLVIPGQTPAPWSLMSDLDCQVWSALNQEQTTYCFYYAEVLRFDTLDELA